MADLRAALDKAGEKAGKRYLLTMAVQAADEWLEHTEMSKVARSLDFANLMAYDQFEPGGDPMAGHHAPLFTHPSNPKHLSAATAVSHFIAAGVPAAKVVLGVPFYGHASFRHRRLSRRAQRAGRPTRRHRRSGRALSGRLAVAALCRAFSHQGAQTGAGWCADRYCRRAIRIVRACRCQPFGAVS